MRVRDRESGREREKWAGERPLLQKSVSAKATSQDLAARVYGIGNASRKIPVMIYTVRRSPFKSHYKGLFGIPPNAETQNDGPKLKVRRNNNNLRAQKLLGPAK